MSINSIHGGVVGRAFVCLLGSVALAGAGCTKPNPKNCGDGSCTDPAFPFCDVDGSVGGEANTCIAVTCTADAFVACRDDLAVTCNAQGNNYDEIKCDKGCDPTVGCRVCDPNQTVCADGKLQTCDASGAVTSSETCALGCFEDQPRCRDIDPSNGLAMYLDMVSNPPDLNLTNAHFDTNTGDVSDAGSASISVPSFLVPAAPNGVPIRVFVANTVTIQGGAALSSAGGTAVTGTAFAIVARGDIKIAGSFTADARAGGAVPAGCLGGFGHIIGIQTQQGQSLGYVVAAGGGGGHATDGASGGSITGSVAGGAKGLASGTQTLIPLRGGCPGGYDFDENGHVDIPFGAPGGGAIQLSSRTSIEVDGAIDVRGQDGYSDEIGQTVSNYMSGGGAGGGILLEAPSVVLGAAGKLLATGGSGAGCNPATVACARGGAGATAGTAAVVGSDAPFIGDVQSAGGGGGGLGRIRINTADGTYTKSNTTIEDAALSTDVLGTR